MINQKQEITHEQLEELAYNISIILCKKYDVDPEEYDECRIQNKFYYDAEEQIKMALEHFGFIIK